LTFPIDVQDTKAIECVVSDVVSKLGRVDLLFNNAGILRPGTLNTSVDDFDEQLRVNLRAPFCFLKSVVPVMKQQGSGIIINLASRAGKIGFDGGACFVLATLTV
jgi:NAD(P)-dependent dehydrogenase (short-subunit alcohol dehydrogenase family)